MHRIIWSIKLNNIFFLCWQIWWVILEKFRGQHFLFEVENGIPSDIIRQVPPKQQRTCQEPTYLASTEIWQGFLRFTRGISPSYSTTMLRSVRLYTIELSWMSVKGPLSIYS